MLDWLKTERQKWATPRRAASFQRKLGLTALNRESRDLFETILPRNVGVARLVPDREPINSWMPPDEIMQHYYVPGQIILGKFGGCLLGHLDDRPMVTVAAARAGKTTTMLVPNLYLYPGSMLVLDPKGELAATAAYRRAMGHVVHVLDPFGASGEPTAFFNALEELDPESENIIDDVIAITQALIVDNGDDRSRHWDESAKTLLLGIILLTMTFPPSERHFVTVRQLLTLTYPPLLNFLRAQAAHTKRDEKYFDENRLGVETLLGAMARKEGMFGGILAAIGNRFLGTPHNERGSIFSTAAAQTDFLDSLPIRRISRTSSFRLAALRSDRPTTIYLCLPVGRMQSHYRWLRLIVQMACTVLEQLGTYPRDRAPILFMMEEFATLGHMEIMERAAAYFPGFGVKLHVVLQDTTQLVRYYRNSWETFLGNAGLVQCFANGDEPTLEYISRRISRLAEPFELRTILSRQRGSQVLMMEGLPPAAALRLSHEDVAAIRASARRRMFELQRGTRP